MTLLQTANIDREISRFKKELDRSGAKKALKLKSVAKKSERKRLKNHLNLIHQNRRARYQNKDDRRPLKDERLPSFRFIRRDGDYFKIEVHRKRNNRNVNEVRRVETKVNVESGSAGVIP